MKKMGTPFHLLAEVDSTNNYAMRKIIEGQTEEGTAIFAHYQTEGKGQRGHVWVARSGDNVNLSLVLQPQSLKPTEQFILSAVVALAVYDVIKKYAGTDTRIKWSNDLFVGDKKIGGILIENLMRGHRWTYAVVGIGINLNQATFPEELPNPISLRQITEKKWDPVAVATELCKSLENRYSRLSSTDFYSIIEEYKSCLYRLGIPALYKMGKETFEGTIQDVQIDGHLILQRGKERLSLSFGQVQFVV